MAALVAASPGTQNATPEHFFVFNGTTLSQVADAPNSNELASYETYMLVLPTGQVLVNNGGTLYVYTDTGTARSSWLPHITSVPHQLAPGGSYTVAGTQLNGLTQGAAYGDDYQDATNYPLVRITNISSGDVAYARTSARTFGSASMSVGPGVRSSVTFRVPTSIGTGSSELQVVANGISSPPVAVTIE